MSAIAAGAPALHGEEASERQELAFRAGAFFALALLASLQYGELLLHPPALRLIALAAIVTVGCASLSLYPPGRRGWLTSAAVLLVTLLCALLVTGVPAHLLLPSHWGSLAQHVRDGADGLGSWLWPYRGEAQWPRLAVLLVVPVVLLAAGGLCFWPARGARRARRAAALALLIALFLTGAANTPSTEPGLHGLLLLVLIAAWLWPVRGDWAAARAMRWLIVPALLALVMMPALSSSRAWIDFRETPGAATPASFQWDQVYGPIDWPRSSATMLTVQARHLGLLRVTSLDRFDGIRFLRSPHPPGLADLDVPAAPEQRWVSRETIKVAGLRSRLLAGEGMPMAFAWTSGAGPSLRREADGTLVASSIPTSGTYSVTSYAPSPSVAELQGAPRSFPAAYMPYASFELPARSASGLSRLAAEAGSHADGGVIQPSSPGAQLDGEALARVSASPYAPMLRLAQGLAAGARSSYEVAERIERYLLSNYSYDEDVPAARYPLEAFLFEQRRGYCQQFSGAMTLMLRMDGIPARVAAGFKPDLYEPASRAWRIRPLDAHSWVEVFFSGIGWITFDPTPASSGAVTGSALAAVEDRGKILAGSSSAPRPRAARQGGSQATLARSASKGAVPLGLILALTAAALVLAAAAGLWLRAHLRLRRALSGEASGAVAELRRALQELEGARASTTLAQLELSMREEGEDRAAAYVRGLRLRRYAPTPESSSVQGRSALRRALMRRSRWHVAIRVLLAMPPGAIRAR